MFFNEETARPTSARYTRVPFPVLSYGIVASVPFQVFEWCAVRIAVIGIPTIRSISKPRASIALMTFRAHSDDKSCHEND